MRHPILRFGGVLLWVVPAVLTVFADAEPPTYAGQVSRILGRHCTGCHRAGGVGPFPLTTYDEARAFAFEIRRATQSRKMPPWFAAPGHGEFQNQRLLSVEDITTLGAWFDAGAPPGEPGDIPARHQQTSEWVYGPPDIVLTPKRPYLLAGTPGEEVRCFLVSSGVHGPRVIRAIDVIPGDAGVVYAVRVFADADGSAERLNRQDPRSGFDCTSNVGAILTRSLLGQWEAGTATTSLPDGVGRYLKSGADVVLEVHYHRTYRPAADRTRVALYFLHGSAQQYVRSVTIANRDLRVPLGVPDYHARAEWVCDHDIRAIGVMPYMHRLGTGVKISTVTPEGTVQDLVWVNRYNLHWETEYVFADPILIRKGTAVRVDASYDNSYQNMNLDIHQPLREARWGNRVQDEVLAVFLDYVDEVPSAQ
jgi:hypothetical protein